MVGSGYDAGALKAKAEELSIRKNSESPIQARVAQIQTELEYLAMDIGALSEKTQMAHGRQLTDSDEGSKGDDQPYDSQSPLQRQLVGILQTLSIQRGQIRHLAEIIEL